MADLRVLLRGCGIASLCIGMATAAAAQDAPPATPEAAAESSGGLADIVVTAQKRAQNLQNVPIAVTALSSNELNGANVDGQMTLPKLTPNLNFTVVSSFASAYIRGVGTQFANPGLETSVSVYLNDSYIPRAAAGLFSFNDVERIEVLKGPQGTLYGRNTTGGTVRIITHDPKDTLDAAASLTLGSYHTRNIDGMINLPLAEGIAVRFAARHAENDGYVRNLAANGGLDRQDRLQDRNEDLYTGKLLIDRGRFKIKLSGDYSRKDDTEGNAFLNLFPGLPEQLAAAPPFNGNTSTGFYSGYNDFRTRNHIKAYGGELRIDYDADFATISSITAYRKEIERNCADLDATDGFFVANCGNPRTRQFTQELQLVSSSDGPLDYIAGVYYLHERSGYDYSVFGPGTGIPSPLGLASVSRGVKVESIAPYAQVDYEFNDAFSIAAGVRYTHERKTLLGNIGYLGVVDPDTGFPRADDPVPTTGLPCLDDGSTPICANQRRRVGFDRVTPKITLSFKPADRVLLYATWSRGFKSGGFNLPTFGYSDSVGPETLDDYEVGWKIERGNVRWNGSAFYYDYQDLQFQTTDNLGGTRVRNAAAARVIGVETDITWAPGTQFEFGAGGGYLDSKYKNFRGDAYYSCGQLASLTGEDAGEAAGIALAQASCAARGNLGLGQVGNQILSGNRLVNAPKFSGYVRAQFTQPIDGLGTIRISGIGNYRTRAYFDPGNLFVDRARFLLSGRITFTSEDERFSLSVYGENLTDKKYDLSNVSLVYGGWRTPAAPRMLFVQVGVKM